MKSHLNNSYMPHFYLQNERGIRNFPYDKQMKMDHAKNERKWEIQEESKSNKELNEDLKDRVEFCCQQVKKLQGQLLKREVH